MILSVSFGTTGYQDYTTHADKVRQQSYFVRHGKENWNSPMTAVVCGFYGHVRP